MLQTKYKAKETALMSYVAIFGVLLSFIHQKTFWGDFKAFWVDFWNIMVSIFKIAYEGISYVSTLCDKIPQPIIVIIVH